MSELYNSLYIISTGLLIPVIVGLFLLLALSLSCLGGTTREYITRLKCRSVVRALLRRGLDADPESRMDILTDVMKITRAPDFLLWFISEIKGPRFDRLAMEKVVDDIEININKEISKVTLFTRIGPMLGLMGTLIPLGPALVALSTRNIDEMARNLVVAFTTTVIGLCIGCLAFLISIIKKNWYAQDLSDIRFLLERIMPYEDRLSPERESDRKQSESEVYSNDLS
ncbi:MAG: MotA/TolQ/ExbB proton channel family protein [Planctomycetota bacterium]